MRSTVIFFRSIIITLLIISCNKKEKSFPMNNLSTNDIVKYKQLALFKGDTTAYNSLSVDYMDSPYEGFLYTALIMANKYNCRLAYEDTYYCLTDFYHKKESTELEDLDPVTRKMALDYLRKGAKKGSKECKRILGNHYLEGKYIDKDTIKGKLLIKESY